MNHLEYVSKTHMAGPLETKVSSDWTFGNSHIGSMHPGHLGGSFARRMFGVVVSEVVHLRSNFIYHQVYLDKIPTKTVTTRASTHSRTGCKIRQLMVICQSSGMVRTMLILLRSWMTPSCANALGRCNTVLVFELVKRTPGTSGSSYPFELFHDPLRIHDVIQNIPQD